MNERKEDSKYQELFLQAVCRFLGAWYIYKHTMNDQQILTIKLYCISSQVISCVFNN